MDRRAQIERLGNDFIVHFVKLRDACSDDPTNVDDVAGWEKPGHQLAQDLSFAAAALERFEEEHPRAFEAHIDDKQILLRRDYDKRWARPVHDCAWHFLAHLVDDVSSEEDKERTRDPDKLKTELHYAVEGGEHQINDLTWALDSANLRWGDEDSEDGERVRNALEAFDYLDSKVGFALGAAIGKRRTLPFILIPASLSRLYGAAAGSLENHLEQAQRAWFAGAPWAALALQRAILESLLGIRYPQHRGEKLHALLDALDHDGSIDFPPKAKLKMIRIFGNRVLHDPEGMANTPDLIVLQGFAALRTLIESWAK
jgi:hypothetical protein